MKTIHLIFGTCNCKPVGEERGLLETCYQRALKPFLSVANRFPRFPIVLYYSGILLEWIEQNHPEFIMLLSDMVKRKQVELLTGGYYEPVLPLIPNSDKLGQIEKLTTFLRGRFGKRPRGSWLTERIWDSSLVPILSTSGIEYTFIADELLRDAGLDQDELYYPYLTEDQGKTIIVFPLSETLHRIVPQNTPKEVLAHIIDLADSSESRTVSLIDNGMRFGWEKDSYQIVYEQKWLEEFLELIQEREDIITPINPSFYVRQVSPRKKVYFPTTTYPEMMSWMVEREASSGGSAKSITNPDRMSCVAGGLFRHFLTRYPESNLMYSKMMYVHLLVNQIRGDKYRKKTAREELWKSQFHSAYWHDRNGGIYLNGLRKQIYRSFIEAEKITRSDGIFTPSITSFDFDMDGKKEYLYQSRDLNAYIHTFGGMIFELDYLPIKWNYEDTLSRHREYYHRGEEKIYDWYLRKAFIDHFFNPTDTVETFGNMSFKELGDFVEGSYELKDIDRDHFKLVLLRNGSVSLLGGSRPMSIEKRYRFKKTTVYVDYELTNLSGKKLSLCFGSELNLAFASNEKKDLVVSKMDEKDSESKVGPNASSHRSVKRILLQDLFNGINIEVDTGDGCGLWHLPVKTASRSDSNHQMNYQSTCLIPRWQFVLEPENKWQNTLTMSFTKREKKK